MLDNVTLDQLRMLIATVETGSFSGAARRLGRVQSAVSQSVQTLETQLAITLFDRGGKTPKLNETGQAILEDARRLVRGADALRRRAQSIAQDIEPELTIAVDSLFPNRVLMDSLKALQGRFPNLPVTLFTEGLGGPEQRLRDGMARLAITSPFTAGTTDLEKSFLATVALVPVVAMDHPLADAPGPLGRELLEEYIQLVLTDRLQSTSGMSGFVLSQYIWRFTDLNSRLEYLLAGFGWCTMPLHIVEPHISDGRLKRLDLADLGGSPLEVPLYAAHERGRVPRQATKWLIEDLGRRLRT